MIKIFLLCFSRIQENGTVEMSYCVLLFYFYIYLPNSEKNIVSKKKYTPHLHILYLTFFAFASVKNNLNLQRTFLLF